MECRSLGESKSNYTTNATSVRQMKQKDTGKKSSGGGLAMGLVAGAAVGALAGVLLAPEKGNVMRKKVADSASKLGDQVSKSYTSGKEKASSWTEKLTKKDGKTNAHVNEAPTLPATESTGRTATTAGNVQKSPYTDTNKHSDQEVKSMINDAKDTTSNKPGNTPNR
ncbi:YtxH domain-containing protein [Pontibacter sp. E15-1]|uniref:YtxH domain-containing protein n=1 Tax=Pontibacter sp. E15-1 TaxID=2919918 RepID=UPI001F4FEE5F|nr:YtxH domain-containing protein [Pontibacter sp. E15-1]MCJ8165840.1 YtxH domain-containing protein [Pontibacter sp. E15-1]